MKLVVFAHTPPPHHGQSFMVQQLLEQLREQASDSSAGELEIFHVNARLSDELDQIGHWRWSKLRRAIRYVKQAIGFRFREGARAMLYIPAPGIRAAVYRDFLIVGVCRLFFSDIIYYWQAAGLAEWVGTRAPWWERWLSNRLLRRAALSIVLGEINRADAQWALSRQIAVIPNGVKDPCLDYLARVEPLRLRRHTERVAGMAAGQPGAEPAGPLEFRALFIGLCCEEKGLFDAMDAVALVNEELSARNVLLRVTLSVAGTFSSEMERARFDERLQQSRFSGAVVYRGFVSGEAKRLLFEEHDCLVFPTHYVAEGSPLVLIEAMAFNLPVVTTNWRSVPELLPAGYEGIVEPGNARAVAAALARLLAAPYERRLRERFLDQYTLERHAARVKAAVLRVGSASRRVAARVKTGPDPLSLTYSLADQDFARTKSIGIFNVSVQLARALASEPRLGKLTVLANSAISPALLPDTDRQITIWRQPARTPPQRILWDQWRIYSEAARAGNEWLLLPKGFASFVRRPTVRLAAYVHDMMHEVYAAEYPGRVSRFENLYFQRAMVATLRDAELIFTNTEFTAGEVRRVAQIYGLREPQVACVGIGFERPEKSNAAREEDIIVLTSRLPHKRSDLALEWLQRWQDTAQFTGMIHLLGSLPENARCPERAGWSHVERMPEIEYRHLLQRARALVYFSDHEGFGMPPVEAALAGACPVFSALPPTREAMAGTGLAFANSDYESFRHAMNTALTIPNGAIQQWAEQLLARHCWSRVAHRMVTAMREAPRR